MILSIFSHKETAFGVKFDILSNLKVRLTQMTEILGTHTSYRIGFGLIPAIDLFFNVLFILSLIILILSKRKKICS